MARVGLSVHSSRDAHFVARDFILHTFHCTVAQGASVECTTISRVRGRGVVVVVVVGRLLLALVARCPLSQPASSFMFSLFIALPQRRTTSPSRSPRVLFVARALRIYRTAMWRSQLTSIKDPSNAEPSVTRTIREPRRRTETTAGALISAPGARLVALRTDLPQREPQRRLLVVPSLSPFLPAATHPAPMPHQHPPSPVWNETELTPRREIR